MAYDFVPQKVPDFDTDHVKDEGVRWSREEVKPKTAYSHPNAPFMGQPVATGYPNWSYMSKEGTKIRQQAYSAYSPTRNKYDGGGTRNVPTPPQNARNSDYAPGSAYHDPYQRGTDHQAYSTYQGQPPPIYPYFNPYMHPGAPPPVAYDRYSMPLDMSNIQKIEGFVEGRWSGIKLEHWVSQIRKKIAAEPINLETEKINLAIAAIANTPKHNILETLNCAPEFETTTTFEQWLLLLRNVLGITTAAVLNFSNVK